jgi:putative Ca2+/H+ antiporter (TMEM165/GDT1 family)
MKTYAAVFLSVFLAELGDKTQLATLFFATNPAVDQIGVFTAAASALVASSALAVAIGAQFGNWVAPTHLRTAAGVAFIAIGAWILFSRA